MIHFNFFRDNLDDILFANKNKSYGAYYLRRSYAKNMVIGMMISLFVFAFFIIFPYIEWHDNDEVYEMTEVILETPPEISIPKYTQKSAPALPEEPVEKNDKPISRDELPKVIKDETPEPNKRKEIKKDSGAVVDKSNQASKDSNKTSAEIEGDSDLPFDFVDVMPQFPGGQGSLARFISSKLVYPPQALQQRVEGVVVVGFIIDKNGKLRNPKIIKSLYPACDEEALRVIRLSPDWIPAKNQGRSVSINFKMPIEFKLIR